MVGRGSLGRRRRDGTEGRATPRGGVQGADRPYRVPSGILLLPYVNETVLCKVKRAARNSGIQVNVSSYTPDTLKRKLVHSPHTDPPCPSGNRTCRKCQLIKKGRCTDKNVVYELTCKLCGATHVGESKRPLRLRFNEHLRSAANSTQFSPIGHHFATCHQEM